MSVRSRERTEIREARELERRRRQLDRSPLKFGLFFAAIAILLAAGIDAIATQIGGQLQSSIVTEFFAKPLNLPYNEAVAMFSTVNIISYLIMPIAPFYKALSDKYGRKPFLAFNIIVMGIGLMLCAWSPNIVVYYIGFAMTAFMTSADMQIVYLYEVAPQKKRATFYGIVKGTGAFCIVLVPRESDMFLKQRIAYLEQPYEKRHPKKGKKESQQGAETGKLSKKPWEGAKKNSGKRQKTGVFAAMKHLMKNRQLFWLTVVSILFSVSSMTFSSYMESIMTDFGMATEDVTTALFLYPFMNMGIT